MRVYFFAAAFLCVAATDTRVCDIEQDLKCWLLGHLTDDWWNYYDLLAAFGFTRLLIVHGS